MRKEDIAPRRRSPRNNYAHLPQHRRNCACDFCACIREQAREAVTLRARVAALEVALRDITDSYESKCEGWDEWCGSVDCYKCGNDAERIASARAALTA